MSTSEVISGNYTLPLHCASSFSHALITYSISSFRIINHILRNATKALSLSFFCTTCRFFSVFYCYFRLFSRLACKINLYRVVLCSCWQKALTIKKIQQTLKLQRLVLFWSVILLIAMTTVCFGFSVLLLSFISRSLTVTINPRWIFLYQHNKRGAVPMLRMVFWIFEKTGVANWCWWYPDFMKQKPQQAVICGF